MSVVAQPLLFEVLQTLFYSLREHNFSLGVAEFKEALKAFSYGFGCESPEDMVFTLQTLWGKSLEEQEELRRMLLEILSEIGMAAGGPAGPGTEPEATASDGATAPEVTQDSPPEAAQRPHAAAQNQTAGVTTPAPLSFLPDSPASALAVRIPRMRLQINPNLDLVGNFPIRQRHMKRAWRYYRRMQRSGPRVELDIQGTMEQISQNGQLLEPVMIARRTNQAQVLILIDEGGSMIPFRRVVDRLLLSVRQGGLSRYAIWYFHDVPRQTLFRDAQRTQGKLLPEVLAGFKNAGVLLISDGGAARGSHSKARVRHTLAFLEQLRRYSPNAAWINPAPQDRWQGSSAGAIQQATRIPMLELTRDGLDEAVDVMRGKLRGQ